MMKVMIVKELMTDDFSPVAMFKRYFWAGQGGASIPALKPKCFEGDAERVEEASASLNFAITESTQKKIASHVSGTLSSRLSCLTL